MMHAWLMYSLMKTLFAANSFHVTVITVDHRNLSDWSPLRPCADSFGLTLSRCSLTFSRRSLIFSCYSLTIRSGSLLWLIGWFIFLREGISMGSGASLFIRLSKVDGVRYYPNTKKKQSARFWRLHAEDFVLTIMIQFNEPVLFNAPFSIVKRTQSSAPVFCIPHTRCW